MRDIGAQGSRTACGSRPRAAEMRSWSGPNELVDCPSNPVSGSKLRKRWNWAGQAASMRP
jgi:hypothetical protein